MESLLLGRVALGVAWAGTQRAEAEPAQQVVDGLERTQHAELVAEDAADVRAAQDADAVGLGGAGAEAAE